MTGHSISEFTGRGSSNDYTQKGGGSGRGSAGAPALVPRYPRTTPTPILLRSCSGYLNRTFSASCFDLKGFDKGVNAPSMYWNRIHFLVGFGMSFFGC